MTPNKVANYLFLEMCSHSAAGFADKGLETWYEDGLEFMELILDNGVGSVEAQRTDEGPNGEK